MGGVGHLGLKLKDAQGWKFEADGSTASGRWGLRMCWDEEQDSDSQERRTRISERRRSRSRNVATARGLSASSELILKCEEPCSQSMLDDEEES